MIVVAHTRSVAVGIALNRCLATFGHQPVLERDGAAVFDLLTRDDPELVIVDASSGDGSWPGMVRTIREQPIYRFLVVLGTGGPSEVLTAYRAGADEYFRFPFEPNEFGARLGAAERIMHHLRSPGSQFDEGPLVISELPAWANIDATLTNALADTLCVACQRVDEPFPSGPTYVSSLKFSLAKPRGCVTLHLVIGEAALIAMTGLLLGTPSNEQAVLVDACKEVLNTLGGTFKREALPDHDFTTGIPEMATLEAVRRSERGARFKKTWTIGWGKHLVGIQATISSDDVQMLPLHSLTEGMVLADDVRNPLGVLIAPRGTHLTESAIKRLYGVLGGSTSLRVSNVA